MTDPLIQFNLCTKKLAGYKITIFYDLKKLVLELFQQPRLMHLNNDVKTTKNIFLSLRTEHSHFKHQY